MLRETSQKSRLSGQTSPALKQPKNQLIQNTNYYKVNSTEQLKLANDVT